MESCMLIGSLAVLAAVGVVILSALLLTKLGRGADDSDHDGTTARHTGATLSALFLLPFAIAIVVPWTTADAARQNTHAESEAIVGAYWSAGELPAPVGPRVRAGLRDYVRFVIGTEWGVMANDRLSPAGWSRLDTLRAQVVNLRVTGGQTEDARADVLDQFQLISAARSQRALDAKARPPRMLLYLTAVTGLGTLLFPFLAGARPRKMTIIPLGVMAGLLGLGIYLTFDISHVFSGGLRVAPDAFTAAQQELQRIPAGR
jgi:hypothetical protein